MWIRILMFILVCNLSILNPMLICAEIIKGHFDYLPLMKEKALKDQNKRAVDDIDYIQETPDGEFFEVDNGNKPIEAIVFKLNKIKQSKPLKDKDDEDLLIYYFHSVEKYARSYTDIVSALQSQDIPPGTALFKFSQLYSAYPEYSATPRALSTIKLGAGDIYESIQYGEVAIKSNRFDSKAWLLLSLGEYSRHNKDKSQEYFMKAFAINPKQTPEFWELNYIKFKKPSLYHNWLYYTDDIKKWEHSKDPLNNF